MEAASRAPLEPLEPLKDDGLDAPSVPPRAESPAKPLKEGPDLDLALLGEEIPLAPLEELETPAPVSRASAEASTGKSPAIGAGKPKAAAADGKPDVEAARKPESPAIDRSFDEGSVVDSDELLSAALSMTDMPETASEPKATSGASSGPSAEDFLSEPLTLSDDVPSDWMPGSASASESASGSTSGAQKSAAGAAVSSSGPSPGSPAASSPFASGSSSSVSAFSGGQTPASSPGGSSSDSPWGAGGLSLADDLPPIPDFDELPPLPPVEAAPVAAAPSPGKSSGAPPAAAATNSRASRSSAAAEQVPSNAARETSSSAAKRPQSSKSVAAPERSSSPTAAPREPSSAPAAGKQDRSPSSTASAKSRAREGSASSAAKAPAQNASASSATSRPSIGGEPSAAGTLSIVSSDSAPAIAPSPSPAAASTRDAAARPTLSLPPQPAAKPRAQISVSTAPAAGSPETASKPAAAAPAAPIEVPTPAMDRDFIARNQIVERYISGKLPLKGATEFEKFCSDHPELLDELGLPERVNAGLRLLEAAGKPEPWQETPKKFWEKPHLAVGLGVATFALLITLGVVWSGSSDKSTHISRLEKLVAEQPLEPATSTRSARVVPSYKGASNSPAITVGGPQAQLADLKIDVSKSAFRNFRVTIDRIDEGRVAILHNVAKDSNGHVRIALNTSALGPGNYQFTLDGINWKGETQPDAWVTVGIAH